LELAKKITNILFTIIIIKSPIATQLYKLWKIREDYKEHKSL
jgi:hypothetical protein